MNVELYLCVCMLVCTYLCLRERYLSHKHGMQKLIVVMYLINKTEFKKLVAFSGSQRLLGIYKFVSKDDLVDVISQDGTESWQIPCLAGLCPRWITRYRSSMIVGQYLSL